MILLEDILLDEGILTANFSCDLKKCKGACCTFPGDFGAPLLDEEIGIIESCVEPASKYLSNRSLKVLKKSGFYEGFKGDFSTICINKRDCVFVYFENSIAFCALEKAFYDGLTDFKKPLSCHLFPIRVRNFGGEYLQYMEIDECRTAVDKGKHENVSLHKSLKESLIRKHGKDWFEVLDKYILQLEEKK